MQIQKLLVFLLLATFIFCQRPCTAQSLKSGTNKHSKQIEYLDREKIQLNGSIPFVSDVNSVIKLLGKPDSIVTPDFSEICVAYFDADFFQYAYFKGITFEKYHDTLVFKEIDFTNDNKDYLIYGTLKLNQETTIAEVKKYFPVAAKHIYKIDKSSDQFIKLETCKEQIEDKWILIFRDNKLVKVEYWLDC